VEERIKKKERMDWMMPHLEHTPSVHLLTLLCISQEPNPLVKSDHALPHLQSRQQLQLHHLHPRPFHCRNLPTTCEIRISVHKHTVRTCITMSGYDYQSIGDVPIEIVTEFLRPSHERTCVQVSH
jgi:hypothetical protein